MRVWTPVIVAGLAGGLALLASSPSMAVDVLDQSNEATVAGTDSLTQSLPYVGQTFTAGLAGPLSKVDVSVGRAAATTDLTVEIRATSGGLPTGPALSSVTMPYGDIGASRSWITFTFVSPITVTSGVEYAIVLTSPVGAGTGYNFTATSDSAYPDGRWVQSSNGTSWNTNNQDIWFRTYVDVPSTVAGNSPAPVMQQFGKPGTGTCDAAAPTTLNWSGVASGGWGESWGRWEGYEGPLCTRTLVYSTAQSKWVVN